MKIEILSVTQSDKDRMTSVGLNGEALDGRKKILAEDTQGHTATLYVEAEIVDRLGEEYLRNNITLSYSKVLNDWQATLSQAAYYNDSTRYPEIIMDVEIHDIKQDDGAEVYRGIDSGKLYMRQVSLREDFARWLRCSRHSQFQYTDVAEVRANVVFRHKKQVEKVTYHDWNGNAAYPNTFNRNFRGVSICPVKSFMSACLSKCRGTGISHCCLQGRITAMIRICAEHAAGRSFGHTVLSSAVNIF